MDFWAKVYLDPQIERPTQGQIRQVCTQLDSTIFTIPLDKIKNTVLPEFQGDIPVATIDFFAVFRARILMFELIHSLPERIVEDRRDTDLACLLPYFRPVKKASQPFSSLDAEKPLPSFLCVL
jgi:hypothetical protein